VKRTVRENLIAEFAVLTNRQHDPAACEALRARAAELGESRLAALCLHQLAIHEAHLSHQARLYSQLVSELPESWTYAALGYAQQRLGRMSEAATALCEALALLDADDERHRRSILNALESIEGVVGRGPEYVREREARLRCERALAHAKSSTAVPEQRAALLRGLRAAKRRRETRVQSIYLDGLLRFARAQGDTASSVRYAVALANTKKSVAALQTAALELENAEKYRDALALARRALRLAKRREPVHVEQLQLKVKALRERIDDDNE